MAGIQDILRPVTITKVVSRIAVAVDPFLAFMGMNPGGRLERIVGGRDASYDVFNNVRTVGLGRAPGTSAGRRARNPVGRVPFTFPRMHEEVFLLAEEISNLRRIGGPSAERDLTAQDFIRRQMVPPAQRAANFRMAMMFGMLKDQFYVGQTGSDWYFQYSSSGSLFQLNQNMPAGNKGQLNMTYQDGVTSIYGANIIDIPWNNPSANIPYHLDQINAAFLKQYGGRLEHIVCNAAMWNNVVQNDYVASQAGIANPPFTQYEREVGEGPDGTPVNEFLGRITCKPWITFHITDNGLFLGAPGSEIFAPHVDNNMAIMMPGPRPENFEMLLGSEPIAEYENGPWQTKIGMSSWTKTSFNPTGWECFTLDNALPVNYNPTSVAYPTLVY